MQSGSIRVLELTLLLSIGFASDAFAGPVLSATGVYTEDFGFFGTTPDTYSIGNDLPSESTITSVTIELSTSAGGAYFDPAGSPFVVFGVDIVGFDGFFDLTGNQTLTLNFSDFDPGETFTFGVETDDAGGGFTTGADFAGATLETNWAVPRIVTGTYVAENFFTATARMFIPNPEPGTFGSVCLGLIVLAARRPGRGARRVRSDHVA